VVIGCVLVIQGIVNRGLTLSADSRARQVERDAIVSMAMLSRIARDTEKARMLVGEHIEASTPAGWTDVERRLDNALGDLDDASNVYAPLVELPNEASEWDKARAALVQFHTTVAAALALSRQDLDASARVEWQASRAEYADLDPTLETLVAINQKGALDATNEIEADERTTRQVIDVIRVAVLIGIGLLAWWLSRQITRYERQLQDTNEDLDAFAGRIAHDLKNAIGPILLSSNMLRRHATEPDRVRYFAQRIEKGSGRLTQIVDSLLAFSRAARGVAADEAVEVRSALDNVLEEVRPLAARLGATIVVEQVPDVKVRCDAGLLHVVLANIVNNAVKYLDGQPERRVHVSVVEDNTSCRFDIADTGPGIPNRDQAAIFEPFYRSTSTHVPGTGIGLATVRRIVDSRGGRIAVRSEEGHGARFIVWLPLADPDTQSSSSSRPDQQLTLRSA
jgi:signal transduction histidine kinase